MTQFFFFLTQTYTDILEYMFTFFFFFFSFYSQQDCTILIGSSVKTPTFGYLCMLRYCHFSLMTSTSSLISYLLIVVVVLLLLHSSLLWQDYFVVAIQIWFKCEKIVNTFSFWQKGTKILNLNLDKIVLKFKIYVRFC